MYHGAVAVKGPGFASSDQSTAGTVLVGDQITGQNDATPFVSNEPSTRGNQDLVIAAVLAPTEVDMVAALEKEKDKRVQDQFDRFLQQPIRAETVNLEIPFYDDRNKSLEEAATNKMSYVKISKKALVALNKKHQGGSSCLTAKKKRLACLGSILTGIIVIIVVITVAVFPSKTVARTTANLFCNIVQPHPAI